MTKTNCFVTTIIACGILRRLVGNSMVVLLAEVVGVA
jgi:hypothetical protein